MGSESVKRLLFASACLTELVLKIYVAYFHAHHCFDTEKGY